MATIDEVKTRAKGLAAQQNATPGLKALVAAVGNYIALCADLLGSGRPAEAPDFSDLISKQDNGKDYKSLTDTNNTSKLVSAYDRNVDHVRKINRELADNHGHVGRRVSDIPGIIDTTCVEMEKRIGTLQSSLDSPRLAAPPAYDVASEGRMIDDCLTAVNGVHDDMQGADRKIQQHARQIANTQPPPIPANRNSVTQSSPGYAPVNYGKPMSSSQVNNMVSGVTDPKKKKFLHTALSQQGDPYVWGAEGPNAFDCSGLVQYSAREAGISDMPRTSEEQYHATMSHPVAPKDLQPGDLIFPNAEFNGGNPGHVMIYAGNGQVVEAPQTGDHVKVIGLSEVGGYHATRF